MKYNNCDIFAIIKIVNSINDEVLQKALTLELEKTQ